MAKQYSYRVLAPRFDGGVLYKPGERDVITRDQPFPKGTKDVELIPEIVAKKAVAKQVEKTAQKKATVNEGNVELSKTKTMATPDFTGGAAKTAGKKSNVVTL
jgi:hypothetical protein